ncbi:MAG: type II 3-dehydroquinate dehydratase [Marivibrio sp.]|uniref:type II 3-dehydroquinate dehydratase n=1 Tax=Marivibrio sp. TaxID=2039719 RepID=UPI0032EC81C3
MADPTVMVLNGPNLNMLGKREPAIYGATTLADVERMLADAAKPLGLAVDCRQSNHEGELVTWCQQARETHAGLIINAGAYTHTSLALRDAVTAAELPLIEVHLSNIYARESFRHHSYLSPIAAGVICGLGVQGYVLALQAMAEIVKAHVA